jgi:Cu2+-exporting ATPase
MAEVTLDHGPAAAAGEPGGLDPAAYVRRRPDGTAELSLVVENLHCPSCIPRIEGALTRIPGVTTARVNLSTRRLALRWHPETVGAEALVGAVAAQGFRLAPYDPGALEAAQDREGQALLRALAVAGFAGADWPRTWGRARAACSTGSRP